MNCPRCNEPLSDGSLVVKGTVLSFLLVGLSWQHLWWQGKDGLKQPILEPGRPAPAFRCPSCSTFVFSGIKVASSPRSRQPAA